MRTLLFILFSALTLLAAPVPADRSTWIGLGAGADQHLMLDVGVPFVHSGAASWGCDVGYVGLNAQDQNSKPIAPGATRETDFGALQFGGWADWGRGYAALGVERVTQTFTTNQTTYTPNTHFPVANSITSDTAKFGAYVKLGYRISTHLSVYVSAGSQSKVLGGLGIHF